MGRDISFRWTISACFICVQRVKNRIFGFEFCLTRWAGLHFCGSRLPWSIDHLIITAKDSKEASQVCKNQSLKAHCDSIADRVLGLFTNHPNSNPEP